MRDRDFEEGILNPFKFGMEEEKPVRYLLVALGGTLIEPDEYHEWHEDLYECAKEGERLWQKNICDWFIVFDIHELRVITQAECAKLISDREHREAVERQRAYKGK